MRTTCPNCHTAYDIPTHEVISEAARIQARKGGSAKSERKTAACRENGRKGGRPKKPNDK